MKYYFTRSKAAKKVKAAQKREIEEKNIEEIASVLLKQTMAQRGENAATNHQNHDVSRDCVPIDTMAIDIKPKGRNLSVETVCPSCTQVCSVELTVARIASELAKLEHIDVTVKEKREENSYALPKPLKDDHVEKEREATKILAALENLSSQMQKMRADIYKTNKRVDDIVNVEEGQSETEEPVINIDCKSKLPVEEDDRNMFWINDANRDFEEEYRKKRHSEIIDLRVDKLPEIVGHIPEFSGEMNNQQCVSVYAFISAVEKATSYGWKDVEKVIIALKKLKGMALQRVMSWDIEDRCNWKILKTRLFYEFRMEEGERRKLMMNYKPRPKENESLMAYVCRVFEEIDSFNENGAMDDKEKESFVKSLLEELWPRYRTTIITSSKKLFPLARDLQECVEKEQANHLNNNFAQVQAAVRPQQRVVRQNHPAATTNSNQGPEYSQKAPNTRGFYNSSRGYNSFRNKNACFKCGKLGHFKYECRQNMTCYSCGRKGHSAGICRSKNYLSQHQRRKSPPPNSKYQGRTISYQPRQQQRTYAAMVREEVDNERKPSPTNIQTRPGSPYL